MPRTYKGTVYEHPFFSGDQGIIRLGVYTARTIRAPTEWILWHADTEDKNLIQRVCIDENGEISVSYEFVSTLGIIEDRDILPYFLQSQDLQNKKFKEVATEYAAAQGMAKLYRVTDFLYIDNMGRWFDYNPTTELLRFRKVILSGRSGYRDRQRVDGYTRKPIYMSAYQAAGLAGLYPETQSALMVSNKIDFHHMDENLFDIRPKSIAPIPTWVHRDFHYPRNSTYYDEFFSKHITWYLFVFVATWQYTTPKGKEGPLRCLATHPQRVTVLNTAYAVFLSAKNKERLPVFPEGKLSLV